MSRLNLTDRTSDENSSSATCDFFKSSHMMTEGGLSDDNIFN